MELCDVVKKLTGDIIPAGESHTDRVRYENLEETIKVVRKLVFDLKNTSHYRSNVEYSMKKAGITAYNFLKEIEVEVNNINK